MNYYNIRPDRWYINEPFWYFLRPRQSQILIHWNIAGVFVSSPFVEVIPPLIYEPAFLQIAQKKKKLAILVCGEPAAASRWTVMCFICKKRVILNISAPISFRTRSKVGPGEAEMDRNKIFWREADRSMVFLICKLTNGDWKSWKLFQWQSATKNYHTPRELQVTRVFI